MISKILILIGVLCLGLYGFFTVKAYYHQKELEQELEELQQFPETTPPTVEAIPLRKGLKEGDLFGRLEIPRLNMSVMVMEGDEEDILRLGAGHIPGTPMAIAGHRDTFFRPLKDVKASDIVRLTTPEGTNEYRVVSTKIVGPKDTYVLDNPSQDSMTLITCYPFYYVGPAPKRFIVQAVKN